jgi:hypothetical protein
MVCPTKTLAVLTVALAPALVFGFHRDNDDNWRLEDQETVDRSFTAAGPDAELAVHNFMGYVHVNGYDGNVIKIHTVKHMRAETKAELEDARRLVTLEMTGDGNHVLVKTHWPDGDGHHHFSVWYDHDIEVPRGARLDLKNFNHGTVEMHRTRGDFRVETFNGGIDLEDIEGSGSVKSFNAAIKAVFSRNPERETSFRTFNGSVDVYFEKNLNAELRFKTFHGGVYTDFDLTMPAGQLTGRRVWGSGGWNSARAGQGGPVLSFDGFNGPIRVHAKS